MKDRTKITILSNNHQITYKSGVLSLGSCFSVHISDRLSALKYSVSQNPCGITFNPASIMHTIKRIISPESLLSSELQFHKGLWSHPDFHSSYSHPTKEGLIDNVLKSLNAAKTHLNSCDYVIITLGTSFVYRSLKTGRIVNNCHKLPSADFSHELLSVEDVLKLLSESRKLLSEYCDKELQFIFTVSPIRHIKNGLAQDKRSKATALLAIQGLAEQHRDCHYFPSYEIMLDDLRDYRYYKEDLIHPSAMAIDYIFERFTESWLDAKDAALRKKISSINSRQNHRALFPETEEHQLFLKNLDEDIKQVVSTHPFLAAKF